MAITERTILPPHLRSKPSNKTLAERDASSTLSEPPVAVSKPPNMGFPVDMPIPNGHMPRVRLPNPQNELPAPSAVAASIGSLSLSNSAALTVESQHTWGELDHGVPVSTSYGDDALRTGSGSSSPQGSETPTPPPQDPSPNPPLPLEERTRLKQLLHDFLQRFDGDRETLRHTSPEDFYAVLPESLIELFDIARERIQVLQYGGALAFPDMTTHKKKRGPAFLLELLAVQNQIDKIPGLAFLMPMWGESHKLTAIIKKDLYGFNRALLVTLFEEQVCAVCDEILPFGARATVLGCAERHVVHTECVDVGKHVEAIAKCPMCPREAVVKVQGAVETVQDEVIQGGGAVKPAQVEDEKDAGGASVVEEAEVDGIVKREQESTAGDRIWFAGNE